MLHNLQSLRAFAALNVVLFHIIGTSESYDFGTETLGLLGLWGANGVDLFFVLSGFIMFYSQRGSGASWSHFLCMRVIRIVPTYWFLSILLFFLIAAFPSVFRSGVLDLEFLGISLLFLARPILGTTPYLYLGWTLEFEFLFYLLFAISLALKRPQHAVYFVTAAFVLVVFGVGVTSMCFEFVLGALIALATKERQFPVALGWVSLLFGSSLLLAQIAYPLNDLLPRLVYSGIPAIFVVFGLVVLPQRRMGLAGVLGDASYSIYLIQVFTIPAFYKFLVLMNVETTHTDFLGIMALVATAFGGWLLYVSFERPVTRGLKRFVTRSSSVPQEKPV